MKQWRLLSSELDSSEQYNQFLELVKSDLEDLPDGQAGRKHLFMGRPATAFCGAGVFVLVGGERMKKTNLPTDQE